MTQQARKHAPRIGVAVAQRGFLVTEPGMVTGAKLFSGTRSSKKYGSI